MGNSTDKEVSYFFQEN